MPKTITLLLFIFTLQFAKAQVIITPQAAGAVVGTISTLGRGVVTARNEQKQREEQEEMEAQYSLILEAADTLFAQGKYEQAIDRYNQSLQIRQEQYPRDQIARAQAEIARTKREEYQLFIDRGDSLYAQLDFSEATTAYQNALKLRPQDQYPKQQIANISNDSDRWQRVHFSGLLISDSRSDGFSSKAFSSDPFSDLLKPGNYPELANALTYSSFQTIDGIAIPKGTRVIIYTSRNYQGEILLDITGPAIVNNSAFADARFLEQTNSKDFEPAYQERLPQNIRRKSNSDMNKWISGSMKITLE